MTLVLATLPMPSTSAADDDADRGWVSTIQYAPDTGFVYTLGNMRDGRSIRVFLGVNPGAREAIVNGKKHAITITNAHFKKKDKQRGIYEYQFKDIYAGTANLSQKSTWEFSVKRKITALRDVQFKWWENYLNSHLIGGKRFRGEPNLRAGVISKKPLLSSDMGRTLGKGNSFQELSIDSAIGRIDLKFKVRVSLFDHRRVTWRGRDNAHLLYKAFALKKGESLQLDMQVKITPNFSRLERYQPIALEKDVYTSKAPVSSRHVLVPTPKVLKWEEGHFYLGRKAQLFHYLQNEKIAKSAQGFFADRFQIDLQEGVLDKRWKHCLVLSNRGLPKTGLPRTAEQQLERLQKMVAKAKLEGSYALQVTDDAILIVGKSERGAWNGLMTLFQLSRHQVLGAEVSTTGLTYDQVNIADYPAFNRRGIYVRIISDLDIAWSRAFVAAMAELKYNQVYLHFSKGIGVRFRSQEACYDQDLPSLSVEEFTEFVDFIKSLNMEIIPIWAAGKTMLSSKHFEKHPDLATLTINKNINWDISLQETFAYHKSILDEIIEITGAKTIHIGLDEIYHFAQYCRKNTGRGDIILAEYINRFTDYYAPRGIRTIVYHDMLLKRSDVKKTNVGHFPANAHEGSEKALDRLRNREMLSIEDWSYAENKIYSDFDYFLSKDFSVYGSCWFRYENVRSLSAYTKGRSDTFVCTYWARPRNNRARLWDPRGSRELAGRFKTYQFLPAMGLAGEAAWNAKKQDLPYNFLEETLLLFNQRKGLAIDPQRCQSVDFAKLANRDLADLIPGDGVGFIDQGRAMDLRTFPSGKQIFGGIPFQIAENKNHQARAISVDGAYTTGLPKKVRIPLGKERYASLVFMHTCHFDFRKGISKSLSTHYVVTYGDGSTQKIKLANDRNIMAWAPALTRFDPNNNDLWLAWTGTTEDGLPTSIYSYHWKNPHPNKPIVSVVLQAGTNSDTSVFLLALTGIKEKS